MTTLPAPRTAGTSLGRRTAALLIGAVAELALLGAQAYAARGPSEGCPRPRSATG